MKKIKILLILILFAIILTGCGKNSLESNSWLVDSVAPTSSTKGKNGDMYLDNSTYNLYQMIDSEWIKIGNIAGKDGIDGKNGVDGKDGINGISGSTPTISISKDGYWVINGNKTNIKAEGFNGKDGADGKNGTDGKDGIDGKNGTDGKDGITPTIKFSEDGYWIINGEKTLLTISEDGYWIINGQKTNTKAFEKTLATICKYQNNGVPEKTAGAKYSCEVKPGTSYNFYVLTTPNEGETSINLIMDRNICEDGIPATSENKCTVAWQTSGANADGPVTAMNHLYKATKDWINIPNIEMNYTDEGKIDNNGYGNIVTTDVITKITKKDATVVTVLSNQEGYNNLKARLPYKREITNYDSTNKTNAYLYDYLTSYNNIQTNTISEIYGYWTLSSYAGYPSSAWDVNFSGVVNGSKVSVDSFYGIRAVINLKI